MLSERLRLILVVLCAGAGAASGSDALFINGFESEPSSLVGITAAHNVVRAGVGVSPLFWNGALAASAQAWADQCMDGDGNGLIDTNAGRSDGFPWYVGENIFGSGQPVSPAAAVELWASEVQYYDYPTNTCEDGHTCSHYTQVVWSESVMLGCGISSCPLLTFGNSIVCDYGPGGNTGGWPY